MNIRNVTSALGSLGSGRGTENGDWPAWDGCTGNASDDFIGNYTILWSYEALDVADPWKSFNPIKPCYVMSAEDLQNLTPGSGFQININASSEELVIDNF